MHLFREVLLLFSLNLIDAILTIVWVRNGLATESNPLMANLMENSDALFLGAKILIGTIAAIVLLRWGNRKAAQYGVAIALAVYVGVMGIHLLTYLSAIGYLTQISVPELPRFAEFARAAL